MEERSSQKAEQSLKTSFALKVSPALNFRCRVVTLGAESTQNKQVWFLSLEHNRYLKIDSNFPTLSGVRCCPMIQLLQEILRIILILFSGGLASINLILASTSNIWFINLLLGLALLYASMNLTVRKRK
ncbi:MAG: hypothetical protein LUQ65_04875 [Candidatus Helarchaeota archaeon]|nr:hypothetical protein [Candidatus Helarchaeota archaeon]